MRALPTLLAVLLVATLAQAQTGPQIAISESVIDAGVVPSGAQVSQTFVLENQGDETLQILSVEPDCGCTVVRYDGSIPAGGRGELAARVDVSTFVGPIAKYITVRTNDAANPIVTLTIKAQIRPDVQAHPGYARFLTVVGQEEMKAEQVVWSSNHDDFEIASARSPYEHLAVSVREAEGGEERPEGQGRQWVVEMTLAKDSPVGPMADHVSLTTNHPDRPIMRIPVSGFVRPVLAVTPPFIDFGAREMTDLVTASVRVTNFSEQEINITNATSDLAELKVYIDPDEGSHFIVVQLHPGLAQGEFTGLITLETDSPDVPTLEVEVKGTVL
jgi:hypothetical protein